MDDDIKHEYYCEVFMIKKKLHELREELKLYESLKHEIESNRDYITFNKNESTMFIIRYDELIQQIKRDIREYEYYEKEITMK
jgi:hypothetical protein